MPRIAVTVDMIATGTDIKAVEVVMFMRAVKSRAFFEQMKGRGVRVINPDDQHSITPDAPAKDHFVIVDAVGVCAQDKTDSRPMERKPTVSFAKLIQAVAFGNTEDEVLSSLAGRLARMERRLSPEDDRQIRSLTNGLGIRDLSHRIVAALDPDRHHNEAVAWVERSETQGRSPAEAEIATARQRIVEEAIQPFHDPNLRETIEAIKKKNEIVIDIVRADEVIEVGFSAEALDRAKPVVQSFEQFIRGDHRDEITALQILYSRPYKQRLTFEAIKDLREPAAAEYGPCPR